MIIEHYKKELQKTKFISNPGCYATIILLSILPLADYINNSKLVIDAKSGISGAGKKLVESNLFSEVNENFKTLSSMGYKVAGEIKAPGTLEGGDFIWIDNNHAAVGLGPRTNAEGIRQLKEILGPSIDLRSSTVKS